LFICCLSLFFSIQVSDAYFNVLCLETIMERKYLSAVKFEFYSSPNHQLQTLSVELILS
jgi:hypothetical protein